MHHALRKSADAECTKKGNRTFACRQSSQIGSADGRQYLDNVEKINNYKKKTQINKQFVTGFVPTIYLSLNQLVAVPFLVYGKSSDSFFLSLRRFLSVVCLLINLFVFNASGHADGFQRSN